MSTPAWTELAEALARLEALRTLATMPPSGGEDVTREAWNKAMGDVLAKMQAWVEEDA